MSVAASGKPNLDPVRLAGADSLKPGPAARGRVLVETLIGSWVYLCGLTSIILVLLIFPVRFSRGVPAPSRIFAPGISRR
jgi:hypothetical protein